MIGDKIFKIILYTSAIIIFVIIVGIFISLFVNSIPSITKLGLKFLTGTKWNPNSIYSSNGEIELGILPFVFGTLVTSILALLISLPFSLSVAILLGEYLKKGILSVFIKSMVELLSGIPSVIYGFWGFFMLVPIIRNIEMKIDVIPYGVGIFTSSLVLAIMIIPYSTSIIRELTNLVPRDLKEAAYSMGATRFEVIRYVILPYIKSGIISGLLLSFGRALGETMAVTMVIGNLNSLPSSLFIFKDLYKTIFSPSNTMSSIMALEFNEASGIHLSAIVEIGLILIIITSIINFIGRYVIKKTSLTS